MPAKPRKPKTAKVPTMAELGLAPEKDAKRGFWSKERSLSPDSGWPEAVLDSLMLLAALGLLAVGIHAARAGRQSPDQGMESQNRMVILFGLLPLFWILRVVLLGIRDTKKGSLSLRDYFALLTLPLLLLFLRVYSFIRF